MKKLIVFFTAITFISSAQIFDPVKWDFSQKKLGIQTCKKTPKKYVFPTMSDIDFPGLGTLGLAIRTIYVSMTSIGSKYV